MLYFDVSWGILSPLNLHPKVGGGSPIAAHTKVWLLPVTRVLLSNSVVIMGQTVGLRKKVYNDHSDALQTGNSNFCGNYS